jgi:hypothetical protein
MKVILDIDQLLSEGRISYEEYARFKRLSTDSTINSYREFMADALIFNGIPFIWATALFWWGLKQLIQDCKNTRHTGG